MRLTRGRLWIAALATLLVGIVALNVISLSYSSSSSETARAVEQLERQGSALRAELARELSSRRVQAVAANLGLIVPEPGAIRYRRPSGADAAEAARRIRSGELIATAAAPAQAATQESVVPTAVDVAPAEPAPAEAPDPAPAPEPAPEVAATPGREGGGTDPSGGGVVSP